MAVVISGKDLSMSLKDSMKKEVEELSPKYGRTPHLTVVLVGDDASSLSYVSGKAKACEYVGIKNTTIHLKEETTEEELLALIDKINKDDSVDGLLVQLPLPRHISENKVIEAIDVNKDVDGFHPLNVASLWQKRPCMLPCTPKGIIKLIEQAGLSISGKNACIIGRSNIVGLPISKLLLDKNATVTMCHSRTADLKAETSRADILVVAIGRPRFVTADMVKPGAIVIDVGINRDSEGKLCGDVDFDNVVNKAGFITKVPGGVGPMTITCLMENTLEIYKRKFGA